NSLTGGLISAATLLVLNWAVGFAAYRWSWFERLVEGRPVRIITDGKVHEKTLRSQRITLAQLRSALRKQGIDGISYCKRAVLEPDGTLSAVKKGIEIHPLAELRHPNPSGDLD
ncbi:MAG TPA: YetF domain-containing protein, partial [Polyangia bacterium]|nr:YetF domain-containing protein [Polyangia bacterium]